MRWRDTIKNNGFAGVVHLPATGFYKFRFDGKYRPDSVVNGWLGTIDVYLEDGYTYQIDVGSDYDVLEHFSVVRSSSPIQKQMSAFHDFFWGKMHAEQKVIGKEEVLADTLFKRHQDKEYNKLWSKVIDGDLYFHGELHFQLIREYALKNPGSIVTAYELCHAPAIKTHYSDYLTIYDKLTVAVKQSEYGAIFRKMLDQIPSGK